MTYLLTKLQDDNIFSKKKKIIETMTYWIDYSPLATRVMDYIKFNNFFINFFLIT